MCNVGLCVVVMAAAVMIADVADAGIFGRRSSGCSNGKCGTSYNSCANGQCHVDWAPVKQAPIQAGPKQGPVQAGPKQGPVQAGPKQAPIQAGPKQAEVEVQVDTVPVAQPAPVNYRTTRTRVFRIFR